MQDASQAPGIVTLQWKGDHVLMLDQRELPTREIWVAIWAYGQMAEAIREMVVRGAPAIGIAAGYGMALAAMRGDDLQKAHDFLAESRPTAVNLFWALDRMMKVDPPTFENMLAEARAIEAEDLAMNRQIGAFGAELVKPGAGILTVCNTGALATGGHGTALGIIRTAHEQGKGIHVYSCETRPRQQGLRLTAYELIKEGIPFHSIADGAAASLMAAGKVDLVVAGADRIAANGDTANKLGTFALAVQAKHFGIPMVIAAPTSTLDPTLPDGSGIPIEERAAEELTEIEGVRVAPEGTPVLNPAFDVTPGELIDAIVTEKGIHRAPYRFLP